MDSQRSASLFPPIQQRFSVPFSYEVLFTSSVFDTGNTLLKEVLTRGERRLPARVLFVLDEGLTLHHPRLVDDIAAYIAAYEDVLIMEEPPLIVPGGEQVKNDDSHVRAVHEAVIQGSICRHSHVIAVGGGAVLDMAGYAAATAHRGVRHVRIPTTVLSQNDSGVGVKNGINAFGSKNFLGTFAPPLAVINDEAFLTTLDDRDWRSGISEAIKVALIKDVPFFERIERDATLLAPPTRDAEAMAYLIHRCAALHVEHIAGYGDPFESGSSRPLDFGHWAAHKLESLTQYELRHGEAVAMGIALDCMYAHLIGLLGEQPLERILGVMQQLGFSLFSAEMKNHLDDPAHEGSLFRGLTEFQEHLGGELTIMLLENIGKPVEVHEVDAAMYRNAIGLLEKRASDGPFQHTLVSNAVR